MWWNRNKIDVQYKFETDSKSVVFQQYKMPIDLGVTSNFFVQQNIHLETVQNIPEKDRNLYSLIIPDSQLYIIDKNEIKKDVIYIMKNVTGDVDYDLDTITEYLSIKSGGSADLTRSIVPKGEVQNESRITMKSGEQRDLKLIGYRLKNYLTVPQFANQFILKEGIFKLKNFIDVSTSNVQAYACDGFRVLLTYMNACQFVEENDNLFFSFYKILIKNKAIVNITKNLLAVFRQIHSYFNKINKPEKFYDYLYNAAEKYSREYGQKVFEPFVSLLTDMSIDVKENFIMLVVDMLEHSSRKKRNKISSDFKLAGIIPALSLLHNVESKSTIFQKYLSMYQELTKDIIKGSAYETETYKHKIKQYQEHYQELNKKVEIVAHKQKYYDEIVDDFVYFKKMNEACIETEGYYDPYTPVCRYDKRELAQHSIDEKSRDKLKKLAEEERENPDEVRKMQKDSDLLKDMISNVDEENNNLINEFKKFQIQHENEDDREDLQEVNKILRENEFLLASQITLEELELNTNTNTMSQHAQLIQKRLKTILTQLEEAQNTIPSSFDNLETESHSITDISTLSTTQSTISTNPTPTETKKEPTPSTVPLVPGSIPPIPSSNPSIPPIPQPPSLAPNIPQPPPVPKIPGPPPVPGVPSVPGVPGVPSVPGVPGALAFPPPVRVVKPTKKEIKLPSKVKNLGWKRVLLNPTLEKTIWKGLKEPEVNIEDIVNLFGIKATPKPEAAVAKKANERVTFLNPKRTQSVGITIAKLPPVSDIAIALEEMDDTLITEENIEAINREYIKPDEIEEYKKYKDPSTKFGRAETYLIGVYIVKNSKQKLDIWEFLNNFSVEYDNISEMIEFNEKAIEVLGKNKFIPIIFSYILTVGNILNGGTNKGQADGFNIDVLTKLKNIKDKNNKSILQFVCSKIKEDHPDFENLSQKFSSVKEAFGYPYIDMQKNWNAFKKGFPKIQSFYDALPNDKFKSRASKQIETAKKQIEKINKSLDKLSKKYTDLVKYLGITEKEVYYTQPESLFKLFALFFEDVDTSIPKPLPTKKVFKPKYQIGEKVY